MNGNGGCGSGSGRATECIYQDLSSYWLVLEQVII